MSKREGLRPITEGVVIVVSILLAFGLEATWAAWQQKAEATDLLGAIRGDVVENRRVIAERLQNSEELSDRARSLLTGLAGHETGAKRDSLLSLVGSIFMLNSWDPINDTYAEALGSGRLALVEDHRIRLTLARYQRRIEAVESLVTDTGAMYYGQLEPFMVKHTVYSEIGAVAWREDLVAAPFETDFDALASSQELWNLVTLRLELEVGFQHYLEVVDSLGVVLLDLLPSEDG